MALRYWLLFITCGEKLHIEPKARVCLTSNHLPSLLPHVHRLVEDLQRSHCPIAYRRRSEAPPRL